MHEARNIRPGDKFVLTLPIRVETSTFFGKKVEENTARFEILVREGTDGLDLIVGDPTLLK